MLVWRFFERLVNSLVFFVCWFVLLWFFWCFSILSSSSSSPVHSLYFPLGVTKIIMRINLLLLCGICVCSCHRPLLEPSALIAGKVDNYGIRSFLLWRARQWSYSCVLCTPKRDRHWRGTWSFILSRPGVKITINHILARLHVCLCVYETANSAQSLLMASAAVLSAGSETDPTVSHVSCEVGCLSGLLTGRLFLRGRPQQQCHPWGLRQRQHGSACSVNGSLEEENKELAAGH